MDDPLVERISGRGRRPCRPGRDPAGGGELQEEQPQDPANSVRGTLAGISHLGDVIQFVVLTPGNKEILCRLPRPRAPKLEVGGEVWCTWTEDLVHVFDAGQADVVLADPAAAGATGTEG